MLLVPFNLLICDDAYELIRVSSCLKPTFERSSYSYSNCDTYVLLWYCILHASQGHSSSAHYIQYPANLLFLNTTFFLQRARYHDNEHDQPSGYDYPYPTTHTPPLTTYHALIVCGAARRVCPCDDDMDAKEDDCDSDGSTSDQFSRKQLRNATILVMRRQKLLTNALDGLNLPCVECMLGARWVEGCAVSLSRCKCV